MAKSKIITTSGKRKTAVARASVKPGKGLVRINGKPLEHWGTELLRTRVREPLILLQENAFDIDVLVSGGGMTGQADAIRLAIGRAMAEYDAVAKAKLLDYDRTLVVADVRRKEAAKPNSHGKARAKRQKSYR